MDLFILRHGKAEARAATDADRRLTGQGRRDVARVITAARDDLALVTHLWVSPYIRARQTADIASSLLGDIEPFVTELLVPEADPIALCEQLQLCDAEALLLVSHQPLVGTLVDMLCGADAGYHPMGTSSLAGIDIDLAAAGMGKLCWLRHAHDV
jgi:phosphohistidine phosphatase